MRGSSSSLGDGEETPSTAPLCGTGVVRPASSTPDREAAPEQPLVNHALRVAHEARGRARAVVAADHVDDAARRNASRTMRSSCALMCAESSGGRVLVVPGRACDSCTLAP
eukprot:scaffold260797_cov34-Tisochrysis_lutea.AAC.3